MAIKTNGFVKGRLPEELKKLIKSVASEYGDVIDLEHLEIVPLKGAMTNEVYQITWPTKDDDFPRKVLVRVYGEGVEVFFNREDEIRTFETISKHGQGPRLLGRFGAGRIEEFIHARTLSAADLCDPEISALIAAKLREFHTLDMPFSKNAHLWNTLRKWLAVSKTLCSPKDAKEFSLDTLEGGEINMLEKELPHESQEIGFCHNDLQHEHKQDQSLQTGCSHQRRGSICNACCKLIYCNELILIRNAFLSFLAVSRIMNMPVTILLLMTLQIISVKW
ncbi:probable choline kinase 2 isoform X2 [Morus notabilis]|uniref:probable choline kinase 2 isoform X2 n=1 Tax=Morus notabilis TaxID=981085 RepID=UPI000CED0D06|nr:probable choline kinase 2 isoform X2 [Morus notabilis]